MSLYGEYIREIKCDEIVETDKGFATYRYIDDAGVPSVYIIDIYIRPDFRKSHYASEMANEIVWIAKSHGCKRVIGTCVPSSKGSTLSLKVLLGYGMSLYSASNDVIVLRKDI